MECNSRIPISVRSIVSRVGDNPAGLLSECRRVQQHQFLALWSGSHVQAIFTLIRPPGRARVGRGAAVMEQGQRRQGRQHQRHHTTPLDSLWDSTGRHPRTRICPRHCNLPEAEARSAVWRGGAWRSVFYSGNNRPSHFAAAGGGDNRRAGRPATQRHPNTGSTAPIGTPTGCRPKALGVARHRNSRTILPFYQRWRWPADKRYPNNRTG
jgi:hypothetical protein